MHPNSLRLLPLLALAGCSSTGLDATTYEPGSLAMTNTDDLVVYSAGIDRILVSPKDRALLDALHMVEDRLLEIPREVDEELPPDAIRMPVQMLMGPMSLRAGLDEEGRGFPFYANMAFERGDADSARSFADRLARLVQQLGGPAGERGEDGIVRVPLGPVSAHHGAVGDAVVVGIGEVGGAPLGLGSMGLPAGVEPTLALKMDFGQYMNAVQTALAMSGDEEAEALGSLFDLFSMDGVTFTFAHGAGPDRAYQAAVFRNYRNLLRDTTGIPSGPVTADALALVPADAAWAMVGTVDFAGTLDMMLEVLEVADEEGEMFGGQDPLALLRDMIGMDLQADVLEHLGHEWGAYLSDTTGGGGLSSLVWFVRLEDRESIESAANRVNSLINSLGASQAEGYLEIREWTHGGHELWSLTFPGLPIPLEITGAFHGEFLIEGLSPQAVIAALEQAEDGGDCLLDNPRFRAMGGAGVAGEAFAVSFLDTPQLIDDGFGWVSALTSGLANGLRSTTDRERNAGLILPTYAELTKGAKATVQVSWLAGDDLVSLAQTDRSALVNLCGVMGLVDRVPALLMVPAAAMAAVPAAVRQQQATEEALREVHRRQEKLEQLKAEIEERAREQ